MVGSDVNDGVTKFNREEKYKVSTTMFRSAYHNAHSKNVDGVGRSLTTIFHENMPWRDRLRAELNYNH